MSKVLNLHEIQDYLLNNKKEKVLDFLKDKMYHTLSNNFIFVYGSLRKNEYNFRRINHNYGDASLMYICDAKLSYMKLYDAGEYPIAVNTINDRNIANKESTLYGEIMFCTNNARKAIDSMETSAGYNSICRGVRIMENNETYKDQIVLLDCYIAGGVLEDIAVKNFKVVESGDWSKYLKEVY